MSDETEPSSTQAPRQGLSEVLQHVDVGDGERVSVGDIVEALGERSFSPLMVIFAMPNVFLFIPGSSVFTALPLVFLAVQMMSGREAVWLPHLVAKRSIKRSTFRRMIGKVLPHLKRVESLTRSCRWPTTERLAERAIGATTLLLALTLFLPIPFVNGLPALSIIMLALSLAKRDGRWLAGGLATALVGIVVVVGTVVAGFSAAVKFLLP